MKFVPKFLGKVGPGGRLRLLRPGLLRRHLRANFAPGQVVEVTVTRRRDAKTLNQLAYFHGVVCLAISEETGYEPEEVKDLLKWQFLRYYRTTRTGRELPMVRSLATLTKDQMSTFIDQCIRLAETHLGVRIPEPTEVVF